MTGLETPFLGSQTRGSRGKDRQGKRGILDPALLVFCFALGHLINHARLTCLITNVIVLSAHMNYGSGIYTKANIKQTQEVKSEMEYLGDQNI